MFEDSQPTQEEASLKVHRSRSVRRCEVTTDGRNLVSHAGTAMLSELADRSGLTRGLSAMAGCGISWHTHDPGVVLTHLAVAIADGADCLCDIDTLRKQSELFGEVASVTTAWRAVKATTAPELRAIAKAVAKTREVVWAAAPQGDITIDFDATLLDVHSEKQDAASTYKRSLHLANPVRRVARASHRIGSLVVVAVATAVVVRPAIWEKVGVSR